MPSNAHEKTKSAPSHLKSSGQQQPGDRRRALGIALFAASLTTLAIILFVFFQGNSTPKLRTESKTFVLQTATTEAQHEQGLSGRSSLAPDEGMIFIYDQPAKRCFWMRDMQFPIDMIWLDANRRVTSIAPDAKPESYPSAFCSEIPAQYVIELPAGEAARTNIAVGQTLQLANVK